MAAKIIIFCFSFLLGFGNQASAQLNGTRIAPGCRSSGSSGSSDSCLCAWDTIHIYDQYLLANNIDISSGLVFNTSTDSFAMVIAGNTAAIIRNICSSSRLFGVYNCAGNTMLDVYEDRVQLLKSNGKVSKLEFFGDPTINSNNIFLQAPSSVTRSQAIVLPADTGTDNQQLTILSNNGAGTVTTGWRNMPWVISNDSTIYYPANPAGTNDTAVIGSLNNGIFFGVEGPGAGLPSYFGFSKDTTLFELGGSRSNVVLKIGAAIDKTLRIEGNGLGIGITPTAYLHIEGGTSTASTAPIKLTSGTLNSTAEAGAIEFAASFYHTKLSGLRYALGGIIDNYTADANNSDTGETDLYSYTTPGSTLHGTGEIITAKYAGTFNDATATVQLKVYFGGTTIYNSGVLSITSTGSWEVNVTLIRTGSSTARASVTMASSSIASLPFATQTDLTGITFTSTNIIKITGTAPGGTGGSNDITGKLGYVRWDGDANN